MIVFDVLEFQDRFGFFFDKSLVENSQLKDIDWDKFLKYLYRIAATKISPEEDTAVLPTSLRKEGIYLYVAILALKAINNFVLRRSNTHISSAKEGEVSINYQDVPYQGLAEWELSDPSLQPFGLMLLDILKQVQPRIDYDVGLYPPIYYRRG